MTNEELNEELSKVYSLIKKDVITPHQFYLYEKGERETLLNEYTEWLCKIGYTDADVYAEEPTAVDRYLKEVLDIK